MRLISTFLLANQMDIILAEDQRLLRETARRFLEKRSPISAARRLVDSETGLDREVWRAGAELGWLSVFAPEAYGGMAESAQGVIDAAIIAEQLGRVVFPGPFLPVSVVIYALAEAGSPAQQETHLARLAAGDVIATWCFAGHGAACGSGPGALNARRAGGGFVLDGEAFAVQDAEIADWLLVSAESGKGLSQFLIPRASPGITVTPLTSLDLARRLAEVRFEGVGVGDDALVGAVGGAAALVERQLQLALVLQAAETIGVIDRTLEFTLDYAKQRIAFGRPIGSFQALKHRFAEHATWLEGAKATTAHAAAAVQGRGTDAGAAASMAKSLATRQGVEIVRDCLQIHGGIGMTWDHDIHFYLRRAVSNEALWGTPATHYERLCRLAGL
jgi:alkylation response protein AidB-like acyl-CoA dehydrogenase